MTEISRERIGIRRAGYGRAALLAIALAACGEDEVRLPGERLSILQLGSELRADPELADLAVQLPKPYRNADWPQAGGNAAHAMYHLEAGSGSGALTPIWRASIGSGASSSNRLLAEPIIADGLVYTMDSGDTVRAFSISGGAQVWSVSLDSGPDDDSLFGGGVAVAEGKVFVTTPFAKVIALDAKSGNLLWTAKAPAPMRAAPAFSDGRVFAVTIDNQILVLAADDGRELWTNAGIEEAAGLLGGTSPAVSGAVVVAAYTSGEIIAFDVADGNSLWTENLSGKARASAIAALSDIRGRPAIDRDRVIAIGNGGVMAAIDLKTGERYWGASLGGTQSPWVAGDFVYVMTSSSEIVCLTRDEGRIKWVRPLPPFADMEDAEDPIYWAGPVLVGDRLIVAGSSGAALSVSPYTGEVLGKFDLPAGTHLPPVVADGIVYILSDDATLTALR